MVGTDLFASDILTRSITEPYTDFDESNPVRTYRVDLVVSFLQYLAV